MIISFLIMFWCDCFRDVESGVLICFSSYRGIRVGNLLNPPVALNPITTCLHTTRNSFLNTYKSFYKKGSSLPHRNVRKLIICLKHTRHFVFSGVCDYNRYLFYFFSHSYVGIWGKCNAQSDQIIECVYVTNWKCLCLIMTQSRAYFVLPPNVSKVWMYSDL